MSVQISKNGKSLAPKRTRKDSKGRRPNANDPSDYENSMSEKVQTTHLIGVSMIKNIKGTQLGKAVGHRAVVKSFSGATTKAVKDYLKPSSVELSPDQAILHVGTITTSSRMNHSRLSTRS